MPMIGRRIYPGMKRAAWGFMQSGDFPVPVLHLKFGKNVGSVAYDSSPYGNDGEIHGATWAKGYLGPGLSFDGLDDYVEVLHDSSILFTSGDFTIRFYIEIGEESRRQIVIGKGKENVDGWEVQWEDNNRLYFNTDQDGERQRTYSAKLSEGVQYRIDIVREGSTATIYASDEDITYAHAEHIDPASATRNMEIGIIWNKTANPFKGVLDEIFIYDVALTATQRRQLSLGYR